MLSGYPLGITGRLCPVIVNLPDQLLYYFQVTLHEQVERKLGALEHKRRRKEAHFWQNEGHFASNFQMC